MRGRSAGPPESQDKPRKPGWKQAAREIEFWQEQEKSEGRGLEDDRSRRRASW